MAYVDPRSWEGLLAEAQSAPIPTEQFDTSNAEVAPVSLGTAIAPMDRLLYGGAQKPFVDQVLGQIAQAAGLPANFDWQPYLLQGAKSHFEQTGKFYDPIYENWAASILHTVQAAAQANPSLAPFVSQVGPGTQVWDAGEQNRNREATASKASGLQNNISLLSVLAGPLAAYFAPAGAASATAGFGEAAYSGAAAGALGGAAPAAVGATGALGGAEEAGLAAYTNIGGAAPAAAPAATGALGSAETIPELGMVADPGTAATAIEGGIPASTLAGGEGALTLGALPPAAAATTAPAATPATATPPPPAPTPAPVPSALETAVTTAGASALADSVLSPEGEAGAAATVAPEEEGLAAYTNIGGASDPFSQWLSSLGLGDATTAMNKLLQLGLPIATIAGLFEKPNNPLLEPIVEAAKKAIGAADKYAALPSLSLTPTQQQAIELAKANVGSYKPYLEKSGTLADQAAGGIQQSEIDRYMNPYLQGVLDPAIRDIEEAAAQRREQLRAITSRSGNDLRTPSTDPNRFNVADSLLDRETLRSIGDLSAKTRATGYDTATGLAGQDLNRSLSASNIYGGLGKAEGALGATDVASLTGAGALEQSPQVSAQDKAANASKLYTSVVQGNSGALPAAAQPSTLTNVTGALGVLSSAKDLGLY